MNRVGARAYADRLCDIEIGGKFPLEGHELGAQYVPAAVEGPAEGIVDFCLVMSVRATSTQMASPSWGDAPRGSADARLPRWGAYATARAEHRFDSTTSE